MTFDVEIRKDHSTISVTKPSSFKVAKNGLEISHFEECLNEQLVHRKLPLIRTGKNVALRVPPFLLVTGQFL